MLQMVEMASGTIPVFPVKSYRVSTSRRTGENFPISKMCHGIPFYMFLSPTLYLVLIEKTSSGVRIRQT